MSCGEPDWYNNMIEGANGAYSGGGGGYRKIDDNAVSKAYVDEMSAIDIEQELRDALAAEMSKEIDRQLQNEVKLKAAEESERRWYSEAEIDEMKKWMANTDPFSNAERNEMIESLRTIAEDEKPTLGDMHYDTDADQLLVYDGSDSQWVVANNPIDSRIDLDADGIKFTQNGETMNLVNEINELKRQVEELTSMQNAKVPATMQNPEYEISFTMNDLEPGYDKITKAIELAVDRKDQFDSDFDRAMKGI